MKEKNQNLQTNVNRIPSNENNQSISSQSFRDTADNPSIEELPLLANTHRFSSSYTYRTNAVLPNWAQQLGWQEEDFCEINFKTSNDINDSQFPASWIRWLIRDPLLFKILFWILIPADKKKDLSGPVSDETESSNVSKKWPQLSTLPMFSENNLKKTYSLSGFIKGVDLIIGQVWTSVSITFLGLDLYNFYKFPDDRYGTEFKDIVLGQAQNQKSMSLFLTDNRVLPVLLGLPLLWGLARALVNRNYEKQIDENQIISLKDALGRYEAGLMKDIIRWILPALIPEFIPIFGFCSLLPEPELKKSLEKVEHLLLWDGRISPEIRHKLTEAILQLAHKAPYITRLQAMATLAKIADGVAYSDMAHLSAVGMSKENLISIVCSKHEALQALQNIAQGISPLTDNNNNSSLAKEKYLEGSQPSPYLLPSSWLRTLYAEYLLWSLGKSDRHFIPIGFWLYRAFKLYFTARFLAIVSDGIYGLIDYYLRKQQCGAEEKLWLYIDSHANWECTACGDLPLFYKDIFEINQCFSAYFSQTKKINEIMEAIENRNLKLLKKIDFSNQRLKPEELSQALKALVPGASSLREAYLNNTLIDVNKANVSDFEGMAYFINYSSVQLLDLESNELGDESVQSLAPGLNGSQIQSLNLWNNNIGCEGAKAIAQALSSSHVQTLLLGNNKIKSEGAKFLAEVLNVSQVRFLDLSWNDIGNEGGIELGFGIQNSSVQTLYLSSNKIGDAGAAGLGKGLSKSSLQILDLGSNSIGDEGAIGLGKSLSSSQVKFLDLSRNYYIGDEGAIGLGKGLPGSQVESLDLSSNYIIDDGAIGLGRGLPDSQVKFLDLSSNYIGDEGIIGFSEGLPGSQVETLILNDNRISDDGVTGLAQHMPRSTVQSLSLTSNYIGPQGATGLGGGLPGSQIKSLDLGGNYLGDEGVIGLAKGFNGSQIQSLTLSSNYIGPKGANGIGLKLHDSPIQALSLSLNQIGDEGAAGLGQGLNGSQIQILDLMLNKIGDEGATGLGRGLPNSQVKDLILYYNDIYDEGAAGLGAGLPGSQIISLGLGENHIGSKGAKGLGQGLRESKVEILELGGNNIGDGGILELGLTGSNVQILNLIGNNISHEGAIGLGSGLPGSQVKSLNLAYNNIGNKGAMGLAQGLSESCVQILGLSNNFIGDEGAAELGKGLAKSQVQSLSLNENQIGDEGAKGLSLGLPGSQVQGLFLLGNHIGDEGSEALAAILTTVKDSRLLVAHFLNLDQKKALAHAKANTQLARLLLANNQITDQGARALCRVLPQTDITITALSLERNSINNINIHTCQDTCVQYKNCTTSDARPMTLPLPYRVFSHVYHYFVEKFAETYESLFNESENYSFYYQPEYGEDSSDQELSNARFTEVTNGDCTKFLSFQQTIISHSSNSISPLLETKSLFATSALSTTLVNSNNLNYSQSSLPVLATSTNAFENSASSVWLLASTMPVLNSLVAAYLVYRMAKPIVSNVTTGVTNFLSRQSQYWLTRIGIRQYFNQTPISKLDDVLKSDNSLRPILEETNNQLGYNKL